MRIVLLPIESAADNVLQFLRQGLADAIPNVKVNIHGTIMPLPHESYNAQRRQYYSTPILAEILEYLGNLEFLCALGVTEADLYVPTLNFVFGEAQRLGKAAIISLFRLKPEFYGEPRDDGLFHERALKEAVHEIGHALGLEHCNRPTCVMYFSNSILDTDQKASAFCEKCRSSVLAALRAKS